MGKYLDLPIRMPSMLRDAKVLDAQAGFETGMVGTVTGLIADLMDGMQLDMDLVVDFPDLIFCDDCMAGIRRMARELKVDKDSLALESIKDVGPGGNFLSHPNTYDNFRRELWIPKLFERRNWELWEKDGSPDIFKVAEKKILEMLAEKPAASLPTEVENQIDEIVRLAQKKNTGI
jgi:trimethylamine--corrinoid protein Co-methyltransferase